MFGALCLGIQRQMATDLSWFAARTWTDSTPSHCLKFRWSLARACCRDFACHGINPYRVSHCHYCVTVVRIFRTSSQGEGSSRELSILRATRLHLGVDCSLSEPSPVPERTRPSNQQQYIVTRYTTSAIPVLSPWRGSAYCKVSWVVIGAAEDGKRPSLDQLALDFRQRCVAFLDQQLQHLLA